jgi:hypothetical protein
MMVGPSVALMASRRSASLFDLSLAQYQMLGRLNVVVASSGASRPSVAAISCCTSGVAVAVHAMMGTSGYLRAASEVVASAVAAAASSSLHVRGPEPVPDCEVVGTKVVAPLADAVGLVDGERRDARVLVHPPQPAGPARELLRG